MTKVDIFSGFLGAGKTTLIKKMLKEFYAGQKIVLIENEFGEIGIDGGFLQEAGVEIREMNSGCICCSLVGDFGKAMEQVMATYAPDRIIIEPSGVGKLSDVIAAVEKVDGVEIAYKVTVADATKVKSYMRNFGEFYNNQIQSANAIILSRTAGIAPEKLKAAADLIREQNPTCTVITTPWEELTGKQLADAMEGADTIAAFMEKLQDDHHCCCGHDHEGEHHHHEDGHCCGHHHEGEHHHHEDGHCCGHHHEGEHHHHHEDGHCCGHHHEDEHHHHEDGCCCGHDHDHHDHHHHHADEAFTAWGVETAKKFTESELHSILHTFDEGACGTVLRAKGIVPGMDGNWLHFDYVPEEHNIRVGGAGVTGKLCVIGAKIDEEKIKALFGV
ncbi:MAG: cobalamin biosynthesis protein CobW [Ruminococcaceae bacterium]|nr:cobalamin biosynthesis protein CobW [Oscillospiraceae bacterium]